MRKAKQFCRSEGAGLHGAKTDVDWTIWCNFLAAVLENSCLWLPMTRPGGEGVKVFPRLNWKKDQPDPAPLDMHIFLLVYTYAAKIHY
ncbi:hypothetical protein BaRGS_00036083 [Batillaria attramentaria]|uniref:Uncharacterized protein n=1 Tax=Batillaria attramentaria TaxID=370345 RepID=A0ABD0JD10_9CAEN